MLYKKVFINTVDDLPKEDGYYIGESQYSGYDRYYWDSHNKPFWLSSINWYLSPVTMPTEREESKAADEFFLKYEDAPISQLDYFAGFEDGIEWYKQQIEK